VDVKSAGEPLNALILDSSARFESEQHRILKFTLSLYSLTATHVLDGLIVVCGNGGFGLTSQGHASAPNKKLQSHLAKHVPRVIMEQSYLSPTNDVRVVMVVK
jgi:hypothetical protein